MLLQMPISIRHLGMYSRSPGCNSIIAIGSPSSAASGLYLRSGLGAGTNSSYRIHVFDPATCTMRPATRGCHVLVSYVGDITNNGVGEVSCVSATVGLTA